MGLISAHIDRKEHRLEIVQEPEPGYLPENVILTIEGSPGRYRQVLYSARRHTRVAITNLDATYKITQRVVDGNSAVVDVLVVNGVEADFEPVVENVDIEFHPEDYTIKDVLAYLEAEPNELSRIVAEEALGKNRKKIVNYR